MANHIMLYHGTTRRFEAFDAACARPLLNNGYWTPGGPANHCCFFSANEEAARLYADAARNANIPREVALSGIAGRLSAFPRVIKLFRDLIDEGREIAWDRYIAGCPDGKLYADAESTAFAEAGYDLNDMGDLAEMVEGTRASAATDEAAEVHTLLTGGNPYGLEGWKVELALSYGIDCRPRVVVAQIPADAMMEAKSRKQAERLLARGSRAVRIPGDSMTVKGVDEILVSDPGIITILEDKTDFNEIVGVLEALMISRGIRHVVLDEQEVSALDDGHLTIPDNPGLPDIPSGVSWLATVNKAGRLERLARIERLSEDEVISTCLPCPDVRVSTPGMAPAL